MGGRRYFGSSQIGTELLLLVLGEPFAGAHRLDQLALQLPDHSLWPLASGGLACELCACIAVVVAEVVARIQNTTGLGLTPV